MPIFFMVLLQLFDGGRQGGGGHLAQTGEQINSPGAGAQLSQTFGRTIGQLLEIALAVFLQIAGYALYAAEKEAARQFLRDGPEVRADPLRRRVRAAALFLELYRELPLLSWPREVLDLVVQLEQAFLIFRQRHARMVERMIGRRVGTGGSDGVHYLDTTALQYRVFDDLWKVRRLLVPRGAAPPLAHAALYDFRTS